MIRPRQFSGEQMSGVLNARRHRDGDQKPRRDGKLAVFACSTPGGIETVISPERVGGSDAVLGVLNARRHRDGDQRWPRRSSTAE